MRRCRSRQPGQDGNTQSGLHQAERAGQVGNFIRPGQLCAGLCQRVVDQRPVAAVPPDSNDPLASQFSPGDALSPGQKLRGPALIIEPHQTIVVEPGWAAEVTPKDHIVLRRVHPRARLGEFLSSAEAASVRDAVRTASPWFDQLFVIRPAHNPVSALDAEGAYDAQSDRWQTVGELVDRGYEDAYRQFIDPVVGASGDELVANRIASEE